MPEPAPADVQRLVRARLHAPHGLLGVHRAGRGEAVRAFLPGARAAWLEPGGLPMERTDEAGLFEWRGPRQKLPRPYRVRWEMPTAERGEAFDPYQFPPEISADELAGFNDGFHRRIHHFLGSHPGERDGISGTRFAVWAPNAERVSVVGDFNRWDGRCHPMSVRNGTGVWELFIPGVEDGALYKYELRNRDSGTVSVKTDPCARRFELRPRTASVVTTTSCFAWSDEAWLHDRPDWRNAPISIYELHVGAWRHEPDGRIPGYRDLADPLVDYLTGTGFTHVELMPVMEHPLDESWGYQCTGYFAPTRRFGEPDDLRYLIDRLHGAGIGVILDWVPGHFPRDEHALARFDGSALFEHEDPRRAHTADWGTLAFNLGRREVRSFLVSSAIHWLEDFHADGLRVDAVAAMLYLDYGRETGEWLPNVHGGNEDLDAVEFLQQLNTATHAECPGTITVAEESTAWPGVSRPVWLGGLGFSMKWNMGWMHDTLDYFSHDPVHRRFHHDQLTFGMLYAFSENFVLPLSHDEVVHGKGPLYDRMPGDDWQRHANLRLLYTHQFTWPGKKLLFMGDEFGVREEWSPGRALDWERLKLPRHRGLRCLVSDLNRLYRTLPALHEKDFDPAGFEWIDCHDAEQSVFSYLRRDGDALAVVALNATPVPRHGYRIGVPQGGLYRECFNSDAALYGGSNLGNLGEVEAEPVAWMGREWSLTLTLPPLAGLILVPGEPAS
ncbi:MAG: 1,4-alpha-glucan branching protein GlgB [Gammaproteobacteria bacterium]|jgi:1,4-alpha-glucan branching enzyme